VAAIYDPLVTLTTPARVAAETGMNALAHGVECAYSPARTPEAEAIALATIRRVAAALPLVIDDPSDLAARTAMLEGAVLGGRCLQNASMGAHHGLAQLIGGRTGIPHGLANAILLAHVLRFNAEAIPTEARQIGEAMRAGAGAGAGAGTGAGSGASAADDPAAAVDALRRRVGLPGRLSEVGVSVEDIEAVARMSSGNANVGRNPRPVSPADARSILESAL
jgi:alcohol dehydrogenase class IV